MRRRIAGVACLIVLAVALMAAMPLTASASSYRFTGRNASAWAWGEYAGGGSWDVGVFTGSAWNMSRGGGMKPQKLADQSFSLYLSEFLPNDPSTPADDMYRSVDVWVNPYDAGIDRDLTSAKVAGTWQANVNEWVGEPPSDPETEWSPTNTYTTEAVVDLTWTGSGPLFREMWSSKTFTDGFRWIDHTRRTYRDAALTGSISLFDGDRVLDAALFDADLSNDAGGSVQFGEWPWQ